MSKTAQLQFNDKSYELSVITGTENEQAIDVQKLRADTELITLDSGYKNTGATTSNITFLDGEKGILRYRGYPIEQLAEKSTFIEVAYLLIYGELPKKAELERFQQSVTRHTLIHEDMKRFYEAYPAKAHPMGVVASITCSLSTFYPESLQPNRSNEE
ncbi:MAG: citrate (Si)-synthase, partial [Bacteroidetes bacterium]|nr:citrate (Si)-synthase [Bacteroidota bacterium]